MGATISYEPGEKRDAKPKIGVDVSVSKKVTSRSKKCSFDLRLEERAVGLSPHLRATTTRLEKVLSQKRKDLLKRSRTAIEKIIQTDPMILIERMKWLRLSLEHMKCLSRILSDQSRALKKRRKKKGTRS